MKIRLGFVSNSSSSSFILSKVDENDLKTLKYYLHSEINANYILNELPKEVSKYIKVKKIEDSFEFEISPKAIKNYIEIFSDKYNLRNDLETYIYDSLLFHKCSKIFYYHPTLKKYFQELHDIEFFLEVYLQLTQIFTLLENYFNQNFSNIFHENVNNLFDSDEIVNKEKINELKEFFINLNEEKFDLYVEKLFNFLYEIAYETLNLETYSKLEIRIKYNKEFLILFEKIKILKDLIDNLFSIEFESFNKKLKIIENFFNILADLFDLFLYTNTIDNIIEKKFDKLMKKINDKDLLLLVKEIYVFLKDTFAIEDKDIEKSIQFFEKGINVVYNLFVEGSGNGWDNLLSNALYESDIDQWLKNKDKLIKIR